MGNNRLYHDDLSKLALTAPVYAQARQKADFSGGRNTGYFWDFKLY